MSTTNGAIQLNPTRREWWLRLRLLTPVSHHDPGQKDKSNKSLFRRQAQLVELASEEYTPSQDVVDRLCKAVQVPLEVASLLQEATLPQFLATAILREFIALYGSKDGEGLFSGSERYRYLEERFSHAAAQSGNLFEMWSRACAGLQVPAYGHSMSDSLAALFAMPSTLAQNVMAVLAATPRACVMLARLWNDTAKAQDERYAIAAGAERSDPTMATLHYQVEQMAVPELVVDMPHVSANTLRHQLVREPGMWHLFDMLGVQFGELHPAITAMFYNGGDIKPGATEPSGVFWIRKSVREAFPLLALVSGSTDSFILGEGDLNIYAWVRCRENNRALARAGLETNVSIFDLIDEWTLTRHSQRVESGQMPFSFETLVAGTEIVANFSLSPYASQLEEGALMAALHTYITADASVGGQSARGFGLVDLEFHDGETGRSYDISRYRDVIDGYETYLRENRDELRQWLTDGTLGSGKVIVS